MMNALLALSDGGEAKLSATANDGKDIRSPALFGARIEVSELHRMATINLDIMGCAQLRDFLDAIVDEGRAKR